MTDFPTDPAEYPIPIAWEDIVPGMKISETFELVGIDGLMVVTGVIRSTDPIAMSIGDTLSFFTIRKPGEWIPGSVLTLYIVEPPPEPPAIPAVGSVVVDSSGTAWTRIGDIREDRWVAAGGTTEESYGDLGTVTLIYDAGA